MPKVPHLYRLRYTATRPFLSSFFAEMGNDTGTKSVSQYVDGRSEPIPEIKTSAY
ncbi:unnamed protein product [Nesidiocoris tenuis]|uniref:Uncharacterized protein n=1 Tax=Nesidiocoris tenuis TaxID=355587 RepID=A0A6H5GL79_9HEMI|nr:unnamed protein product [Nesidiocoris tenuis]